MYDDPDNAHDCHEQIISVSSGLPIATWCKSNVFHDYFHEENQCQNRGDRSQRFRVFLLDSPLGTSKIRKKRGEDRRLNMSKRLTTLTFSHGLMVAGKEQMIQSNSLQICGASLYVRNVFFLIIFYFKIGHHFVFST